MSWYIAVLKNYSQFSGRARRKEFWMFSLFNLLFTGVALLVGLALFSGVKALGIVIFVLVGIYYLGVIIPGIAVTVRRLHDTGRSGGWYFITFVPYVGGIVLLVFLCLDSKPDNQYGPNPKGELAPSVGDTPWPQQPSVG